MAVVRLDDAAATVAFGARLAHLLEVGDVVFLEGPLGAGKSTLARACIQTLAGADITVPSPTFTLVQAYELAAVEIWHVDLYRLAFPAAVEDLGLDEALETAALLIEWPDRLPAATFPERLRLDLAPAGGDARLLTIEAGRAWATRLPQLCDG